MGSVASGGCVCEAFPLRIAQCVNEAQRIDRWTGWEWEEIVGSIGTLHQTARRLKRGEEGRLYFQCSSCEKVWELKVNFDLPAMHAS